VLVASHDRELLAQVPRILELSGAGLRSYGGNYADYQAQRDAEQQAARAALEHAATERKRTRARMQKSMTTASGVRQRHSHRRYPEYRLVRTVKYKGAAKSVLAAGKNSITSKMMP
jgi:ATPase subunit of ABC transporter with duplicated ATPase domains